MSRRVNTSAGRRSRRLNTFLWLGALAIITIALIYFEQTEILYILATLGVTALLAVVAMADLRGAEGMTGEPLPADDSAAIGSGLTGTLSGTANASRKKQVGSRK
jgi:hypothetical protein